MSITDDGYTRPGIGLISVGWMGKLHSRAYQAVPQVYPELKIRPRLVHAADTAADRAGYAQEVLGYARASTDYRDVLADPDVDVVIVGAGPGVPEHLMGVAGPVGGGVGGVHQPGPDLQLRIDQRDRLVGAAVQLAHPAHADQADAGLDPSVVSGSHGAVPVIGA